MREYVVNDISEGLVSVKAKTKREAVDIVYLKNNGKGMGYSKKEYDVWTLEEFRAMFRGQELKN